jgi:hypothetical protein
MYEVFAVITDEHGTRYVPTGDGSLHRTVAENLMLKRMMSQPTVQFFIEYTQSEDQFNAY